MHRGRHRATAHRGRWTSLAAGLVVLVLVGGLTWGISGDAGNGAETSSQPTDARPTDAGSARGSDSADSPTMDATTAEGSSGAITLRTGTATAASMAPVRLTGTFPGSPGAVLRVQILDSGSWVDYPLPTVVDGSGRFETYVEIGRRGDSRLRVVEPESGQSSNVVTVTVQ